MLRRGLNITAQVQRWASQATLDCAPATMYLLETAPPTKADVTAEEAVKYYTEMQTIRRMELKADQLYKQKGTDRTVRLIEPLMLYRYDAIFSYPWFLPSLRWSRSMLCWYGKRNFAN